MAMSETEAAMEVARDFEVSTPLTLDPEVEEEGEDEEELLACATCFSTIIYRDDILQEKISSCKEVVYPYELTVCDRESWCYLVTDQQNHRFDLIRARSDPRQLHSSIRLVASPRADFTWFPGYAWRSAHCDECSASIGWGFCAPFQCGDVPDSESKLWNMAPEFLGLVLTRLRPCSKAKAQVRHRQYRESPVQEMTYNFLVPPVELPPWWTRTDRGENSTSPEHPTLVDYLDEDPDAAFRRARSPTPPMRVGVRSATTESSTNQREDLEMQSELLRLLREQARVNRSLRMHQFGTPSNVQHVIPRADAVPAPAPLAPPAPAALAAPPPPAADAAPSQTSEANDSGLLRWLRRLLQSRRLARTPRRREEEGAEETLNQLRQRRRETSPANRTWNLIRQLSSQQQQLAAVRDELLSEQLESSRHLESFQEEQLHTLRSLTARQQQIASEQRQLMEDIIRLQGTVMPSQGQL